MTKPEKPKKWKLIAKQSSYYFDFVSNKVALTNFLDWIDETLPKGTQDITIGLVEDYDFHSTTWIQLEWKEKAPNTKYISQMKKYQKQLKKWKAQQ